MYPAVDVPFAALMRAIKPAQSGATALVPPKTASVPSTRTEYPVCGSASPDTSGTPLFCNGLFAPWLSVVLIPCCHVGRTKIALTPPPPAPPLAPSFQTTSLVILPLVAFTLVPPQASACGLDEGKST